MLTASQFVWPKTLDNAFALFNIQQSKLDDEKILFFIETATPQEKVNALKEYKKFCTELLEKFKTFEYKNFKVICMEVRDYIGYAFESWCVLKNKNTITFADYEEFAKEYDTAFNAIVVYDDVEMEELDGFQNSSVEELSKEFDYCAEENIYEVNAQILLDLSEDQKPRQFHDYVKFFNKEGERIITKSISPDKYTMYEKRVMSAIFGIGWLMH